MKNSIYTAFIIGFLFLSSAFADIGSPNRRSAVKHQKKDNHIIFIENSLDLALKKAKAENKFIFVDAYAVWCGPCKLLKSTTFKDDEVADLFNENFVNLSIDMEKGDGVGLAEKWGINAYPTLLILDADGGIVMGNVGFVKAKELVAFGKKVLGKNKK